jgi:hypothetical protein
VRRHAHHYLTGRDTEERLRHLHNEALGVPMVQLGFGTGAVMEHDEEQQPKRPRRARRLPITLVVVILLGGLGLAGFPPPAPPPPPSCDDITAPVVSPTRVLITVHFSNGVGDLVIARQADALAANDRILLNISLGATPPSYSWFFSAADDLYGDWFADFGFDPFYTVTIGGTQLCQTAPTVGCAIDASDTDVVAQSVDVALVANRPNAATAFTVDGDPAPDLDGATDAQGIEFFEIDFSSNPLVAGTHTLDAQVAGATCSVQFDVT